MVDPVIAALGISPDHSGTWAGGWRAPSGRWLESRSPHDGSLLGRVSLANAADYEHAVATSAEAFLAWRAWPAP